MLENKHNLTVDTQSKSIGNAFVEVVQNDNVALEVQIYNNNLLVDNTAYTYTLLSVLPSKERIIRQGEIGPNGYPVFNLGVEEMSETGIILAMVQVYDELGNRVTSYDFKYRMKEDLSTGGVVPSADNPKFVIITEDSLSQTVQDAQQSKVELDEMKTDTEGVTHLTPNDRLVSDYNKIDSELGKKSDKLTTYTKMEVDNLLVEKANKTQEDWITPTLYGTWHFNEGNICRYKKDDFGKVTLQGRVAPGEINIAIFILPIGYRPAYDLVYPVATSSSYYLTILIKNDGVVKYNAGTIGTYVDLSAISFFAEK